MSSLLRKIRRGTAVVYSNGYTNAISKKKGSTKSAWKFACENSVLDANNLADYFPNRNF
jgi:hypothetical protein